MGRRRTEAGRRGFCRHRQGEAPRQCGILPVDPSQSAYLETRLRNASPAETRLLRDTLKPNRAALVPNLWPELESAKPGDAGLLPVACALALYDPDNDQWQGVGVKLAQALVTTAPESLGDWLKLLVPVKRHLTGPLAAIFRARIIPRPSETGLLRAS